MNKESLSAKLEELKQKFDETNNQLAEYDKVSLSLREQALLIKGEYQGIEKLIAELPGEPVEGEVIKKKGKQDA